MMNKIIITISLALAALTANAQTNYLDSLRKVEPNKGTVVVEQDPAIDDLVNGVQPANPAESSANADGETPEATPLRVVVADPAGNVDVAVDTRKKVMRNSYKTTGYRVQVFSGGNSRIDRQKAEQAGAAMKQYFPTEPVYVHFYSPSWKCRIGNYVEQEDAQRVLEQVKALGYKQACLVKGKISVQY